MTTQTTFDLTPAESARLTELTARHQANRTAWLKHTPKPHTCADKAAQMLIDAEAPMSNAERSELESLQFRADVPEKYFAYVRETDAGNPLTVTTWTGDMLGAVIAYGQPYQVPGFGSTSTRQNLTVEAVNGRRYSAVYFRSAGSYCRMRVMKTA